MMQAKISNALVAAQKVIAPAAVEILKVAVIELQDPAKKSGSKRSRKSPGSLSKDRSKVWPTNALLVCCYERYF